MWTLLLHGLFLDDISNVMNDIHDAAGDFVSGVFLLYIFAGTVMMLNMLIGFQCEVASRIHHDDAEKSEIAFLTTNLLPIMEAYDRNGDGHIGKDEFFLLLQD